MDTSQSTVHFVKPGNFKNRSKSLEPARNL